LSECKSTVGNYLLGYAEYRSKRLGTVGVFLSSSLLL
jgi:hypothetical protein